MDSEKLNPLVEKLRKACEDEFRSVEILNDENQKLRAQLSEISRQRDNLRALVDALGFTNTNELMMGTRTQAIIAGAAEKGLAVDAIRRLNER